MKRLIILLFIGCTTGLYAQQVPFYSQYFFNPFVYNPAFTGQSQEVRAFLMHRNQWTGIQGAPVTTMFTIDGPIQGEKAGIGLNFFTDKTDLLSTTGARVAYSYGFSINDEHRIKLGLGIGILNNKIDYSRAVVDDVTDPNLFTTNQSRAVLDADFGIAYFWRDLNVGIAMPQLLDNNIRYAKVEEEQTVAYGLRRHYIFTAGYHFEINENFDVDPVLLTRITPASPFQFDLGVMGSYQKLVWLGFTYKHQYAIGTSVGGIINEKLYAGLSYDLIINDISGYSGSSTELLVGYIFGESEKEKLAEAKRREELRNELDSLRNKLKETSDQTDKNTKAIDSLGNEIQKVRTDVDGAIEELKKNPPTGTGASVTPAIPVGGGDSEFSNEYLDNKGEPLPKGFYIVVGSYSEQKWARQAKLKFINAGYAETDVLYNITNKFYNVFLSFTTSEEEARKNLRNARAEYPDAWLRKIQ
ncbi:MAG: PorP/SprF family type IX secretion system membrane protein [Vicingaceae bacterium]